MRALTASEATVVRLLMARSRARVDLPPGAPPLPRRTLQTVRNRIYLRGWLRDRFIPAPRAFGRDRVVLALAEPPADRAGWLTERWRHRPENVLLWASAGGLFGVFLTSRRGVEDLASAVATQGSSQADCVLEIPSERDSIPVYFDFEAGWVRASGLSGVIGYPKSLVPPPIPGPSGTSPPSGPDRTKVEELVAISPGRASATTDRTITSFLLNRRNEEHCLRRGWVTFRSFLDPVAVAASISGFPAWIAFVHGDLLSPAHPSDLFRALVGRAGISPFLFAASERKAMFAVLSRGPPTGAVSGNRSVLPVVQSYLERVAVVRWPLQSARVVTDHEYGHLLDAEAG